MYRERLQYCRKEFMAAMQASDAEQMREISKEIKSLLTASLVLITEEPNASHHPHLTLVPHQ